MNPTKYDGSHPERLAQWEIDLLKNEYWDIVEIEYMEVAAGVLWEINDKGWIQSIKPYTMPTPYDGNPF